MFKLLTRGSVRLVERYLPDPYIFVLLLTFLAGLAAVLGEQRTPMEVVRWWGNGFWSLLTVKQPLSSLFGYPIYFG